MRNEVKVHIILLVSLSIIVICLVALGVLTGKTYTHQAETTEMIESAFKNLEFWGV